MVPLDNWIFQPGRGCWPGHLSSVVFWWRLCNWIEVINLVHDLVGQNHLVSHLDWPLWVVGARVEGAGIILYSSGLVHVFVNRVEVIVVQHFLGVFGCERVGVFLNVERLGMVRTITSSE